MVYVLCLTCDGSRGVSIGIDTYKKLGKNSGFVCMGANRLR